MERGADFVMLFKPEFVPKIINKQKTQSKEYFLGKEPIVDRIFNEHNSGILKTKSSISIGWAMELCIKAVRIAREESQAKRLPINWRSNKEVIDLVRKEIKNAREDEINKLQQVDKELTKEIFSHMNSQDPNHNTNSWESGLKKVEVRVREETAREIFDWFDKKATLENNFIILEDKIKTFKKRFLVKSEVQKE